jgi:hypothetical protein
MYKSAANYNKGSSQLVVRKNSAVDRMGDSNRCDSACQEEQLNAYHPCAFYYQW